jgi:hypothetical protein
VRVRHLVNDNEFYAQNDKKQQEEIFVHSGQCNENAIQCDGLEQYPIG